MSERTQKHAYYYALRLFATCFDILVFVFARNAWHAQQHTNKCDTRRFSTGRVERRMGCCFRKWRSYFCPEKNCKIKELSRSSTGSFWSTTAKNPREKHVFQKAIHLPIGLSLVQYSRQFSLHIYTHFKNYVTGQDKEASLAATGYTFWCSQRTTFYQIFPNQRKTTT